MLAGTGLDGLGTGVLSGHAKQEGRIVVEHIGRSSGSYYSS